MSVAKIGHAWGASMRELGLMVLRSIAVRKAKEIMPICVEGTRLKRRVSPPDPIASALIGGVALAVLRRRYLPLLQHRVLQSLNHLLGLATTLSGS